MARSTGPILAIGAITMLNRSVFNNKAVDWRVPIATGVAAGGLAVVEKAQPRFAAALAWMALATILLTRVDPSVPSPAESFLRWWEQGGAATSPSSSSRVRPT